MQNIIKSSEIEGENLDKLQVRSSVLNRFMDNFDGNLTTTKWAKIANCSQDTATLDINDLISKKILKKIGQGRSTHYTLRSF